MEEIEIDHKDESWSLERHLESIYEEEGIDVEHGNALNLPPWFDEEKFKRGQKFFFANYFGLFVSKLAGLLVILTVPEISRILIMTKQSSEPKTAFKRYLLTIAHMKLWYGGQVNDDNSWAYKSLREVHQKHTAANNRGKKESLGVVSQSALAITQFGFMGFGLLMPQRFGIVGTDDDFIGFAHFWRTVGYMVGVQDRYNICRDSLSETRTICQAILDKVFVPVLKKPTQDFDHLATALLRGLWAIVPTIDEEAFMSFTKDISGIPIEPCSNWYSRFMFNLLNFILETLLGSKWFGGVVRAWLNMHMKVTLILTIKFPLLAYYAFGVPLKSLQFNY